MLIRITTTTKHHHFCRCPVACDFRIPGRSRWKQVCKCKNISLIWKAKYRCSLQGRCKSEGCDWSWNMNARSRWLPLLISPDIWPNLAEYVSNSIQQTDGQTDSANIIRGVRPSVRLSRVAAMSTRRDGGDRWTLLPCVFVRSSVRLLDGVWHYMWTEQVWFIFLIQHIRIDRNYLPSKL